MPAQSLTCPSRPRTVSALIAGLLLCLGISSELFAADKTARLLYVAVPGIRDDLTFGGHGILVFDIDNGHKFVKRIPSAGLDEKGKPLNVKGICASAQTQRLYITTTRALL